MKLADIRPTFRILGNSIWLQLKDNVVSSQIVGTLILQPVIFTLISVGTYEYGHRPDLSLFAIIGVGLISIWNTNLFISGDILREERRRGTLSLVMASPTPLLVVLLGKSLANAITSIIAMGLTFMTGMLAFQIPIRIANPLAFLIGLVLMIISITCLGLVFGTLFILTRSAGELMSVANYPVFILSGLSIPLTLLPLWTHPFSQLLSPTWGNLVLNAAVSGTEGSMLPNYLVILGLSVLYLIIAHFLYQHVEYRALQTGTLEQW